MMKELSERSTENASYRKVLEDLQNNFVGGSQSFNEPGYISAAARILFPEKPINKGMEIVSSALEFYKRRGDISIKEKRIEFHK